MRMPETQLLQLIVLIAILCGVVGNLLLNLIPNNLGYDSEAYVRCLSGVRTIYLEDTVPICSKDETSEDCVTLGLALNRITLAEKRGEVCQRMYDPTYQTKKADIDSCLKTAETEEMKNYCFELTIGSGR